MSHPNNIIVAQQDRTTAEALASNLHRYFHSVRLASSLAELQSAMPRFRADVAVVDLETVPLAAVQQLAQEFHVPIICTHRVPDEEMWTAALSAGAADCCASDDVNGVLTALNMTARAKAA